MSPRAAALAVDVSADGVRSPLGVEAVADLARRVLRAEGVREALLSVALVPRAQIARLNREHLGHRGATDVISFALRESGADGPVMGDIYISPEVAREHASEHGTGVREEVARLVIHGVLHVLGHDHPQGDARTTSEMWRRQERHLARFRARAGAAR